MEEKREMRDTESKGGFSGAYELAGLLLDLLQSSFRDGQLLATSAGSSRTPAVVKQKKSKSNTTPISLSMQLVSATAALYQFCVISEEKQKCSQDENNRVMSKIPHDLTRWSVDLLGHIRILVMYTVVSLCTAGLCNKDTFEELIESQHIQSLCKMAKKLMKSGGLVPQETTTAPASCEPQANGHETIPIVEITAPKKNISNSMVFLPDHVEFVFSTLKSLMNVMSNSLNVTSINPTRLTEVTLLLHEFDNCGGYEILQDVICCITDCIQVSVSVNGQSPHLSSGPQVSRSSSPESAESSTDNSRSELTSSHVKTGRHGTQATSGVEAKLKRLLRAWEDVLCAAKRAKTQYIHEVTCTKRAHRHCDLSRAIHAHHDILGIGFSKTNKLLNTTKKQTQKSSSRWTFPGSQFWFSESPKSNNKKNKNHEEDALLICIVGKAVDFIINKLLPQKRDCTKLVLASLDRIGVCYCVTPGFVLLPLLSSLPSLPSTIQDTLLAVVGRLILQRSNTGVTKSDNGSSTLDLPTVELPSTISTVKCFEFEENRRETKYLCEYQPLYRNSQVIPKTPMKLERLLEEYEDHPWLCLSCYRDLLLGKYKADADRGSERRNDEGDATVSLAVRVALHLSTIAPHFDLDQVTSLITTVLLPVLQYATREKENLVHPEVVSYSLGILQHHLAHSSECRRIFFRHGGIAPLTHLLLDWGPIPLCGKGILEEEDDPRRKECSKLAGSVLSVLLTKLTTLSRAIVHVPVFSTDSEGNAVDLPPSPILENIQQEESDSIRNPGFANLLKGFSPLGNLSPKIPKRVSPLRSTKSIVPQGVEIHFAFKWEEKIVNEVSVFHNHIKFLASSFLQAMSALTSFEAYLAPYNPHHNSCTESLNSTDGKDRDDGEGPSSCSDTTGYHTSRDSSLDSSNRIGEKLEESLEEEQSISDLDVDGVTLPDDIIKMKELCDLCTLLSTILLDNRELQMTFAKLDGPEMILRLLTLVTASLIPTNSRLDFTNASSEVSPNRSLLHSLDDHLGSSVRDATSSNVTVPNIAVDHPSSSESRSTLCSTPKQSSQDPDFGSNANSVMLSKSPCPATKVPPTQDDKNLEAVMDLKFQLLSSTLSMALLITEINTHQYDVTSDDIISTLKPLLRQSEISSSKYCIALCECLLKAAVRARQADTQQSNISSTMTSLKHQISSPRKSSPGHLKNSMSSFHADSPSRTAKDRLRMDSMDSEFNFSEGDDTSSVYDMMLNIERVLDSEDGSTTDGYQGDSESDKPAIPTDGISTERHGSSSSPDLLVPTGKISHPKLIILIIELLGDAANRCETSSSSTTNNKPKRPISVEEHNNNIRSLLHTIIALTKYSPENLELLMTNCDLPLACLESFKILLQENTDSEKDIRQVVLNLCLSMNKQMMTARHLRLVLSLFNSTDPPLEQLLQYLLQLIQHQLPGPSQYLQFPLNIKQNEDELHSSKGQSGDQAPEASYCSVWKVAPIRMPVGSSISWPTSNVGVTISIWLHVGPPGLDIIDKSHEVNHSWDSARIVVVDIDSSYKVKQPQKDHDPECCTGTPYFHLVSIGTKQTMLQVWVEHRKMIFRICVDPDDGKQVGLLAQTECDGLLSANGEWQHLTMTYTENKLPDKTILGKVHVIANCITERDVILEHNLPKQTGRTSHLHRRQAQQEPRDINIFLGHWFRVKTDTQEGNDPSYRLGNVMVFDRIHFTLCSAFEIFSRGPNVNTLTDCLVSEITPKSHRRSSASMSSRIRFSSSPQISNSVPSPLSPNSLGMRNWSHFYLLSHSLFLSDLVPERFFGACNIQDVRGLQEHFVLSYSPTDPSAFLFNHANMVTPEPDKRRSFSLFSSSQTTHVSTNSQNFDSLSQQCSRVPVERLVRVVSQCNRGLHKALNQVGGIHVFLLLCAKVVEVTSASCKHPDLTPEKLMETDRLQCLALQSLLRLRSVDSTRQHEFATGNVAAMLHKLLTKSQCIVGFQTLQILFNAACMGDIVIENVVNEADSLPSYQYDVNFDNSAIIHDQELLKVFLADWRLWHKSTAIGVDKESKENFPVWRMLLHGLLSLIREDHPYQWFNLRAMMRADLVQSMLTGLQQMVVDSIDPFPGPAVTAPIMDLLRTVVGSPPDTHILARICDFLVATHPPAGTFVCHASSSFYFNLRTVKNKASTTMSNPTSPTDKINAPDKDRHQLNRSISAPQQSFTAYFATDATLPEIDETAMTSDVKEGFQDTKVVVDVTDPVVVTKVAAKESRNIKTLSIIEEAESTGTENSSRSSTPAHNKVDVSGQTEAILKTSTPTKKPSGANGSPDSWEELPHSFHPGGIVSSPKIRSTKIPNVCENLDDGFNEDEKFGDSCSDHGADGDGARAADDVTVPVNQSTDEVSDLNGETVNADSDGDDGLAFVTCELLNLMFVAVMTMPEKDVVHLTAGPLNSGALVVGVHHKSARVRTATVRILAAYFSRCSDRLQEDFIRQKGFHLVANQLHQYSTTRPLVDACLYFLLGHPVSSEEPLPLDGAAPDPAMLPTPAPDPFTNHAALLLLAVLENSTHDYLLCLDLVKRLIELFECMGPIADVMLDNGLTLALCNLITAIMGTNCTMDDNEKAFIIEEIEHFLTVIAVKACVTSGVAHFQVFEDLFTLLYVIENEQAKTDSSETLKNVTTIQSLCCHILMMVLELMQRTSAGKTPTVPRKQNFIHIPEPSVFSGTYASSTRSAYSQKSSFPQSYSLPAGEMQEPDDGLCSPESEYAPSLPSSMHNSTRSRELDRRASFVNSHRSSKSTSHKRSLSSAAVIENSVMYRPHGGGLRTRSFKGSQRRRINETEMAWRLQRVVVIAVDKMVFSNLKSSSMNRADKETTFATPVSMATSELDSSRDDVFGDDEPHNFVKKLFDTLLEWLTCCVMGSTRSMSSRNKSSSSRFSATSSSSSTSQISSGWERILTISKEILTDQTVRLFTHLMSPCQLDVHMRTFPLSIVHRTNAERMLAVLFPKGSDNGRKVSVYLYYLMLYYKQQMTPLQKKDIMLFCRLFHRCGHKILTLPQKANGVSERDRSQRASTSILDNSSAYQAQLVDNVERDQVLFDNESKRDLHFWRVQNNLAYKQLKQRTDRLSHVVSQHAMDITQLVVLRQNQERKKMIAHMKAVISNDLNVRKQWAGLLEQLAHERAVWYDAKQYPNSWQLDPTEGPNRERRRLQRCHLGIDERFMMKKSESTKKRESERLKNLRIQVRRMVENPTRLDGQPTTSHDATKEKKEEDENLNKRPLSFLFEDDSHSSDSITIRTRLQTNERISMVQSCTNVTTSCETPGEILIGESSMYFVGDEVISDLSLTQALFGECEVLVLSWRHEEVAEVHKRWWQLQDIAIEIFLTNGKTYLLAFRTTKERDIIVNELSRTNMPNLLVQDSDVNTLTQIWRSGNMTNFEYLTQLNKSAGRSFNDLMQYPVMPFVLADYTSAILDLNNLDTFRNLHRPISIPDEARIQHYKDRYKILSDDYNNCTEDERELKTPPSHYGSHYSNSGTVLHFLVRLPPFTRMFLEYQDASFDIPDRTFHSMETTFRLSSYSSTTDVKELIPEFFFLPEFLCNLEGFDFGLRQCGLRVNHVILPPWSKADPRLFTLIHRQALESDYVSANLQGWIDLVFGSKQRGKEALDAVNVFHPATYFGMDVSSVEDSVKRKALETMVRTYGQTPKQLFLSSHPAKTIRHDFGKELAGGKKPSGIRRSSLVPSAKSTPLAEKSSASNIQKHFQNEREGISDIPKYTQRPLSSVLGLKWGTYIGSPSAPDPCIFLLKPLPDPVGSLIPLQTNDVCALAPKMGLLVIYNRERGIRSFKSIDIRWSALLTYGHPDNIVRLKMRKALPDVNLLNTPAEDQIGCCTVAPDCRAIVLGHRSGSITVVRCNPLPSKSYDLEFQRATTLYGHVKDITCLVTCGEFRILASGSADGTVVLWDLDALTYVRSLTGHATAVSSMAISRTSGDVCTVCDSGNDEGSHIRLWTINGSLLAAQDTKRRVGCVTFSSAPEGISVNVVAGGMSNGVIRLWSSWDLNPVRDIEAHGVSRPITCLTFTHNSDVLYAATENGQVIGWCFKDKMEEKQPILISFLNVGEKS